MTQQNSNSDKIGLIAAACAGAFWIYDCIKLPDGQISMAMIWCLIFIIFGFMFLMSTGLLLAFDNESHLLTQPAKAMQAFFYKLTIYFFWFVILYITYYLLTSTLGITRQEADNLLYIIDIVFIITFIFSAPILLSRKIRLHLRHVIIRTQNKWRNR